MYFFAVVALIILVLIWLVLGLWIANLLLYPRRQPILRTPAEYGLPYEEVTFPSKDRLRLKGWWIPAANSTRGAAHVPVVIILHPLLGNRHGLMRQHHSWPRLMDADLDLLQTAQLFHQAGYAVLMFDFRSHGESQRALCAGGLTEDQDVMGAVDYVFDRVMAEGAIDKHSPEKHSPEKPVVGIIGYGLGAAAAFAAIGREKGGTEIIKVFSGDSEGSSGFVEIPPLTVKYLRFVVAVQPVSLEVWLRSYLLRGMSLLGWIVIPLVDWLCQRRGGFPLAVKPLLRFVREVNVPVLYARSTSTSRVDSSEAQVIYDALPGQKELWWLEGTCEPLDAYRYVAEHPATMLAFANHSHPKEFCV